MEAAYDRTKAVILQGVEGTHKVYEYVKGQFVDQFGNLYEFSAVKGCIVKIGELAETAAEVAAVTLDAAGDLVGTAADAVEAVLDETADVVRGTFDREEPQPDEFVPEGEEGEDDPGLMPAA